MTDTQSASTDTALIEQGDEAAALLKHDIFTKTVNQLVETTFQNFVNSEPDRPEKRENAYHHYRALVDIVNTLQQRVAVRDGILERAESDNSDNNGE